MLSKDLLHQLEQHLGAEVTNYSPVSGGDINRAYRLDTDKGVFFVKCNDAHRFPNMFEAESKGLAILSEETGFTIPKTIAFGEQENNSYLILGFLQKSIEKTHFWVDFGQKLAKMHQKTQKTFGLDHHNYIGSIPQKNNEHNSWLEFYVQERLEPQLRLAMEAKEISSAGVFERLFSKLSEIYPKERPALLHGDLWGGNYMAAPGGEPALIDPAVYYGHREMDLAMTRLFGGFDREMYHSYNETYPLEKGWEDRLDVSQLYPLLVHVNLFGGSYVNSVLRIVNRYV